MTIAALRVHREVPILDGDWTQLGEAPIGRLAGTKLGGDVNPWVEGQVAFRLVDDSLKACSVIPDDEYPTPWDYCCESRLGDNGAVGPGGR